MFIFQMWKDSKYDTFKKDQWGNAFYVKAALILTHPVWRRE